MARTKLTTRKSYEKTRNLPVWLLNRDYCKRKLRPFKVKVTFPKQKICTISRRMTKQLGQLMYDEYPDIIQAERKVYFNP